MLGRIYIVIMFLSNPGAGSVAEGSRRDGLAPSRASWDDDDDDAFDDDLVGMIFFVSCSVFLFVLLVLVVIAVMYGQTIIASIQFCESSYFKRLHFCTLVSASYPVLQNPTQPPVFIAPRNRKMWFLYPKSRYSQIFARFSPVKQSNMNRFRNSFLFLDSPWRALQQCRAKFVATQTSSHENNYRNFFRWQMVCVR